MAMIVVTVNVADERYTPARKHIHRRCLDEIEANDYIDELKDRFGWRIQVHRQPVDGELMTCTVCGVSI